MKKRMAILMSMAIAANMIASVPVCAAAVSYTHLDVYKRQVIEL